MTVRILEGDCRDDYAAMARRRIFSDAPLFAEVA